MIAEDTKRDSSSMKAVALLTMLFLPSTYVWVSESALSRRKKLEQLAHHGVETAG